MRQNTLLAALSALTVATAQTTNFTIDAGAINPSTKAEWCNAEYNTCSVLCANTPTANDCDSTTLNYTCTCKNGTAPGLEYYIQSMPTFICEQAYSDCIAANTGSSRAQDECKANIKSKCGTLDPTKANIGGSSESSSSAASSATKAPSASQSSDASQSDATSTSSQAAAATNAAMLGNGIAVVAAGIFAALL